LESLGDVVPPDNATSWEQQPWLNRAENPPRIQLQKHAIDHGEPELQSGRHELLEMVPDSYV
jgi:hypothetical protein